jgi:hypothetical protein
MIVGYVMTGAVLFFPDCGSALQLQEGTVDAAQVLQVAKTNPYRSNETGASVQPPQSQGYGSMGQQPFAGGSSGAGGPQPGAQMVPVQTPFAGGSSGAGGPQPGAQMVPVQTPFAGGSSGAGGPQPGAPMVAAQLPFAGGSSGAGGHQPQFAGMATGSSNRT